MKRILLTCSLSSILIAQQPQIIPTASGNIVLPQMIFHIHSNATAENVAKQVVTTETNTTQQLVNTITTTPFEPDITGIYTALTAYLKKHWLFCSFIAASTLYGVLLTYLFYTHYALYELHHWSRWRNHATFEQLAKQSHEELKADLVKEIATYYINPQNPTDALWPLTKFIEKIHIEEQQLKRYLSITVLIKKTVLPRLLPRLQDEYAQTALARLHFVYHLFTAWAADLTWERLTHNYLMT